MTNSLVLYGSRARGDALTDSDTDLILATDEGQLASPVECNGVSVHRYSKDWLSEQARKGNLFVYHVAFEGVGLDDTDEFLPSLRTEFRFKNSYRDDIGTALLVIKMIIEKDWEDNIEARRRLFWAVRTIYICLSSECGKPIFSSRALEDLSGISGLANMIGGRAKMPFSDCRILGEKVLDRFLPAEKAHLKGDDLRKVLNDIGGIAQDSVRVVEEREAIEEGGLRLYF